jgi:pimeloyl-ACP methyl ester carboxylesterase
VRTISRNGVDLAYDAIGGGFPVVLHTGGAGSSSMWRRGGYVDRLSEFRLILLDHRGRGASGRPTDPTAHRVSEYVADVETLIDHVGCREYGFFGYSFGGLVGLLLAADDPRLTGMAVLGTVFDPPGIEPDSSDYGHALGEGDMAAVIALIEDGERLTLPAWARAEFMETDPEQFRLTLAANAGDPDPWEILARIRADTVLVAGSEEDADGLQDRMAAEMRDARSVHLAGAGHVGAFLRPDEVAALAIPVFRRAVTGPGGSPR